MKKEVTIYDLAEELRLSPSTVSRGLKNNPLINIQTRKRINEVARERGYQHNTFARNLRKNRSYTLGVVVPRLDSYFMSTVISGMEKIANMNGYNLIINQSEESVKKEVRCIETMYNSRVDGMLISLASDTDNLDHLSLVRDREIPLIFFDRTEADCNCTTVRIDNIKAGYEITSHMLEQGCRSIVFVGGDFRRNVYNDRYLGYLNALQEFNISPDEDLVFPDSINKPGVDKITELISDRKVTCDGIFASNDNSAVNLAIKLKHKGFSIPGDIALSGFNNDPISIVIEPNLTTVEYPGSEIGEKAISRLIDMINGISTVPDDIVVPHQLLIRGSTQRNDRSPVQNSIN